MRLRKHVRGENEFPEESGAQFVVPRELGVVVLRRPQLRRDTTSGPEAIDPFLVLPRRTLGKAEHEVGEPIDVPYRLVDGLLDLIALPAGELVVLPEDEPFARPPPYAAGITELAGVLDAQVEFDTGLLAPLAKCSQRAIAS